MQPVSKHRVGKHVSAATDTNATIGECHFLCGPCRDVISRTVWSTAGSNTSTVTLRVVGGDEKGSLKSEIKIWSQVPRDAGLRKTTLARASTIYKRQPRPLVRNVAPEKQDRNCQRVINIWSWAPDGAGHQDLLTDWLTVSRNVTLQGTRVRVSEWERVYWDMVWALKHKNQSRGGSLSLILHWMDRISPLSIMLIIWV
jgi:hypothetical protein